MGNCGSNPKTIEGPEPAPLPAPATQVVKVERAAEETLPEENKSLITLLKENVEEGKKQQEVKAEPKKEEPKKEESKVQEKPITEEAQIEAFFAKREG